MDTTGQRLGRLPQEIGRGAAQHQKVGRQGPAVRQDSQHGKEVRAPLDFVQNNKTAQSFESQQGIAEAREVPGVFQVEHRCRTGQVVNQLSRQGGFADLPGPDDGHDRIASEAIGQGLEVSVALKYHGIIFLAK